MTSLVDLFIQGAITITNTVIGSTAVTLSNGVILNGVWSTVSAGSESDFGGEQLEAAASVIVPAAANINIGLIGKRCTYNSIPLQVSNVEVGTTESTISFKHDTEGIRI
jgi:hypothetical protein